LCSIVILLIKNIKNMENVLLIGNGGREHAILDRLVLSKNVKHVIVCNNTYWNNPVVQKPEYSKVQNYTLEDTSIDSYITFAKEHKIGLVVVGPEKYLADGVVDEFHKHEILCFGPTQAMAQIESSKLYGKDIMRQFELPTAEFRIYSHQEIAKEFLRDNIEYGYQVIKMDGLAGGKGVLVLKDDSNDSLEKGIEYLDEIYEGDEFAKVLIEKKLSGVEVSVLAFCNGKKADLMPPARDFKRIYDGDKGPNTGGMGAICPGDLLNDIQLQKIQSYMDSVVLNLGYKGVLYAGLMMEHYNGTDDSNNFSMNFLEFNCRFGDPETQSILPLLDESSDLYEIMCKCMLGESLTGVISWKENMKSINVVMSQIEYPYKKLETPVSMIFSDELNRIVSWNKRNSVHLNVSNVSYVKSENGLEEYVTTGGRVLSLVVCGTDFMTCFTDVYSFCKRIVYKNMYYRMDIGKEYIIGINKDNRRTHWQEYDLMNIPTIAIFQGEDDSINNVKTLVKCLTECKVPSKGMIKVGLIVCGKQDVALMKLSSQYNIPLLFINDKMNLTLDTRKQVADVLRSFNINMIVSTDHYTGIHSDTKNVLFEEFGSKMLTLDVNERVFNTPNGNMTRFLCNVRNLIKLIPSSSMKISEGASIERYLHTYQFMDVDTIEPILPSSRVTRDVYLTVCFIEYLKIYNQRPLKYNVDIDGGNNFVDYLKEDNNEIGDFCYKCEIDSDGYGLSTDGVGTKIDLALKYELLDYIGIDLVAMSVNDLYVHGIEPIYFLDYLALDKMDINLCKQMVNSVRRGCQIAKCNLVGGETAEMRGMYRSGKCDLGGFAFGKSIDGGVNGIDSRRDNIEPGCLLFGLPSCGVHSNGFTLINDLVNQCHLNAELGKKYCLMSSSKVRSLITPTRIYSEIPTMLQNPELKENILGMAHITGGGFPDNVHRVLCRSAYKNEDGHSSPLTYELDFELDYMFTYLSTYAKVNHIHSGVKEISELYKWIHKLTRCSMKEMFRTFNCGIGMVFVMKKDVDMDVFMKHGFNEFIPLGRVVESI
jgi:phosphoribosylamine--glycine ligase/phosphoribosylaminoimidazole synthetase